MRFEIIEMMSLWIASINHFDLDKENLFKIKTSLTD